MSNQFVNEVAHVINEPEPMDDNDEGDDSDVLPPLTA